MANTGEVKLRSRVRINKRRSREVVTETALVSDLPSCSKVHSKCYRPNASMSLFAKPNDIHQSDLLSLPHDKLKKKTYKYALNIVDAASRYKGSYQLTTKNAKEVAQAFQCIHENTPLNYPKSLIVDDGKEFYGDMTKLMEKHDVIIQCGDPSQHRSQGIVERFNRTLADRLFTYQYHKEFEDPSKSNRE